MTEATVRVEIDTKIRIVDPDQGGNTDVRIDAEGVLNIDQATDNIILTKDASLALARVILQHHQVSFESTYQQGISYL